MMHLVPFVADGVVQIWDMAHLQNQLLPNRAASVADVEFAFRNVLSLAHPALTIWTRANTAHALGEYSIAAILAISALEVAFEAALFDLIGSSLSEDEFAKEMQSAKGVVGKRRLLVENRGQRDDLDTPSEDLLIESARVRNKAAHSGAIPQPDQSSAALQLARQTIDDLISLPN